MPIAALDPAFETRHVLDTARGRMRESLVWVVPQPGLGLASFVYTWVDAYGNAAAAGVAFGPSLREPIFEKFEDDVAPDMGFDRWKVGGMSLVMAAGTEGLQRQHVVFNGTNFAVDYEFEAFHKPYGYGPNDSGCPRFWADDRTEQGGRVRGSIRAGHRNFDVDTFAHRDHSWGTRDWGAIQHMKWINALADPSISVHVMEIQAFGKTTLHGYVHKDGETSSVIAMDADFTLDDQLFHTAMSAVLQDDAGRTTAIRMHGGGGHLVWPMTRRLTIQDTAMHADIDGRDGVAYVDMSWPPEYLDHHRHLATDAR